MDNDDMHDQIYLAKDQTLDSKLSGANKTEINETKVEGRIVIPLQGMFRSGTNFTRTLLELNYNCEVTYNFYGWKHAFLPIIANISSVKYEDKRGIVLTKHPLHQLKSLKEYAYNNGRNFICADDKDNFLKQSIIVFDSNGRSKVEYFFESPIAFYNAMCWNFLSSCSISKNSNIHIQYEAISNFPNECATHIANEFGLSKSGDEFKTVDYATKNMSDAKKRFSEGANEAEYTTNRKFKTFDKQAAEKYWTTEDLDLIKQNVNAKLLKDLKYEF